MVRKTIHKGFPPKSTYLLQAYRRLWDSFDSGGIPEWTPFYDADRLTEDLPRGESCIEPNPDLFGLHDLIQPDRLRKDRVLYGDDRLDEYAVPNSGHDNVCQITQIRYAASQGALQPEECIELGNRCLAEFLGLLLWANLGLFVSIQSVYHLGTPQRNLGCACHSQ